MPKIKYQNEQIAFNYETGEIKQRSTNQTISFESEPSYIKLYLQDIMYLSDMPKHYVALTESLLKRISYASDEDGMCVTLVPRIKKKILEELGWTSMSSLDNALQQLLKGKILIRIDRGVFRFNPYLFGCGDWQDIAKLRLTVTYDLNGRTFSTVCDYKDNPAPSEEEKETA